MSEKVSEGSNSFIVRTLVETVATMLSKPDLVKLTRDFEDRVSASEEAKKRPRLKRHAHEISSQLKGHMHREFFEELRTKSLAAAAAEMKAQKQVELPAMAEFLNHPVDFNFVGPKTQTVQSTLTSLLEPPDEETGMAVAERSELTKILHEAAIEYATLRTHPFVKKVTHTFDFERCGSHTTYLIVGTSTGKTSDGSEFNANCTIGNARKIKDVSSDYLVHKAGRAMSFCHEAGGNRYFVWLLHYKPETEIRFWLNISSQGKPRTDLPAGNARIRISPFNQAGWVHVV